MRLIEADKSRFINKLYKDFIGSSIDNNGNIDNFLSTKDDTIKDSIIKWVNSGAADKFKFDWNSKNKKELWTNIVTNYVNYVQNGGSNKEKKLRAREDIKQLFFNAINPLTHKKLVTVNEGEDTTNADMVILNSLENNDFIFVMPLDYNACVWMDDFSCGGQGAKWCLGWKTDDYYWLNHTAIDTYGSLFIMAFSKKEYKHPSGGYDENGCNDKLKYMVELSTYPSKVAIWKQSNFDYDTIKPKDFKQFVGYTANELGKAAVMAVGYDENDYTKGDIWPILWGTFKNDWGELVKDWEPYKQEDLSGCTILISDLIGKSLHEVEMEMDDIYSESFEYIVDFNYISPVIKDGKLLEDNNNEGIHLIELLGYLIYLASGTDITIKNLNTSKVFLDLLDINYNHNDDKYFYRNRAPQRSIRNLKFENCHIVNLLVSSNFISKYYNPHYFILSADKNNNIQDIYFTNYENKYQAEDDINEHFSMFSNLEITGSYRLWNCKDGTANGDFVRIKKSKGISESKYKLFNNIFNEANKRRYNRYEY